MMIYRCQKDLHRQGKERVSVLLPCFSSLTNHGVLSYPTSATAPSPGTASFTSTFQFPNTPTFWSAASTKWSNALPTGTTSVSTVSSRHDTFVFVRTSISPARLPPATTHFRSLSLTTTSSWLLSPPKPIYLINAGSALFSSSSDIPSTQADARCTFQLIIT